jgi:hypothetical protein
LPGFVGQWLGHKVGSRGRGKDGGADAWLGWKQEKAVVASDSEPNDGGRAEAK